MCIRDSGSDGGAAARIAQLQVELRAVSAAVSARDEEVAALRHALGGRPALPPGIPHACGPAPLPPPSSSTASAGSASVDELDVFMRRTGAHAHALMGAHRQPVGTLALVGTQQPAQLPSGQPLGAPQSGWGATGAPQSGAAPGAPSEPSAVRADSLLSLHKACVRADRLRCGQLEGAEFREQLTRHRVTLPAELSAAVPQRGSVKYAQLIDKLREMGVAPAY